MRREDLTHDQVTAAIKSRLGELAAVSDGDKARVLATYAIDLVDSVLRSEAEHLLREQIKVVREVADQTIRALEGRVRDKSPKSEYGISICDRCHGFANAPGDLDCSHHVATAGEALARFFHQTYEELAPSFGYETRKDSAKPWAEVPEKNRRLMIAVCSRVIDKVLSARPFPT
jgi:hypothetical protein